MNNPIMLYDAKIALLFEGEALFLDAVAELSGSTSVTLQGPKRKTLFGYSPDLLQARKRSSITFNLSTYITKGFPEEVFFRMAGFSLTRDRAVVLQYPEPIGRLQPQGDIYIDSVDGQFVVKGCCVESIDMPFSLENGGSISVTFQADSLEPVARGILQDLQYTRVKRQGQHIMPSTVYSGLSGYEAKQRGQTLTFQRSIKTLQNANCFNSSELITSGHRIMSDSSFGISIQEYVTQERMLQPLSTYTNATIKQSGIVVRQHEGIATRRVSIEPVHSMFWDFKATGTIEIIGPKKEDNR